MADRVARSITVVLVAVPLIASVADAGDQPLDGRRLKVDLAQGALDFRSNDDALPFPALQGPDDPSQHGLLVEIFVSGEAPVALNVPARDAGWSTRSGGRAQYRFRNPVAPAGPSGVEKLLLREGRTMRVRAQIPGVFTGPLGEVGVRLTYGGTRVCAYFDATTVRKDDARRFLARASSADILSDCSHGIFDDGTACGSLAGFPACGGFCPGDEVCTAVTDVHTPGGLSGCQCFPPTQTCSDGFGVCDSPFACTLAGSNFFQCAPVLCSGPGECGDIWGCHAVRAYLIDTVVFDDTMCAPSDPCVGGSSGFACPAGQVCAVQIPLGGPLDRFCQLQ